MELRNISWKYQIYHGVYQGLKRSITFLIYTADLRLVKRKKFEAYYTKACSTSQMTNIQKSEKKLAKPK